MKPYRLYLGVVVLLGVSLACQLGAQPEPTATPTKPPKTGGIAFGVTCNPVTLDMEHGDTQTIDLNVGTGEVTAFRVGTIYGPAGDPNATEIEVTQIPARNATGWSTLPGKISIHSNKVHGPLHIKSYYIYIGLGGGDGKEIAGGNIWCLVNVKHDDPPAPPGTPPTPILEYPSSALRSKIPGSICCMGRPKSFRCLVNSKLGTRFESAKLKARLETLMVKRLWYPKTLRRRQIMQMVGLGKPGNPGKSGCKASRCMARHI